MKIIFRLALDVEFYYEIQEIVFLFSFEKISYLCKHKRRTRISLSRPNKVIISDGYRLVKRFNKPDSAAVSAVN
jgi:hypothetical protein